jgi:genome maintenance exonuclease 1
MQARETIKRVILNDKRYYQVDSPEHGLIGPFPSVTTILGSTADTTGIDQWKARVGEQEANKISQRALDRGNIMHRLCELYLNLPSSLSTQERLEETLALTRLDDEIDNQDNRAKILGGMMFYNYVRSGSFDQIKNTVMQEKFLWTHRHGGYAGTVDNVSELVDGRFAVIDFKTARKPKKEEWIEDYKLQVSAYSVAVWDRHKIKIEEAQIWISNEKTLDPQYFIMGPSDLKEYYNKFLARLAKFYELFPVT